MKNVKIIAAVSSAVLALSACEKNTETDVDPITELSSVSVTAAAVDSTEKNSDGTKSSAQTEHTVQTNAEQEIIMPEQPFGGIDADYNDGFYIPVKHSISGIPGSLCDLRDDSEVRAWCDGHWSRKEPADNISEQMNIYSFIIHFNITREEAETALEPYLNTDDELTRISEEDLDVIFSGDIAVVSERFATDYAIVIGEKIYSPEWLYFYPTAEWTAAGITPEAVSEKASMFSDFFFTDEARTAFSKKLSDFTGTEIIIEPVPIVEKENTTKVIDVPVYDFEDLEEVPEEVSDEILEEIPEE